MQRIQSIKKTIRLWRNVARDVALAQTIVPYLFSVILASKHYPINYFLSFSGLIGVTLAHLGINMLDDYFDWKKGAVAERKKLIDGGMRARSRKCFYLEQNLITLKQLLAVSLFMCALALLIGIFIAMQIGLSVIIIAFSAGLLGFFYSAPPFRLSYNGLGEIAVGIIFGPLLMIGAYITAGGQFDLPILFSSLMIGLFVLNILHTHCIMDFEPDKKVGRISLAVLLKTPNHAMTAQNFILFFAYAVMGSGIILKVFPLLSLLTFITLPIAIALIKLMKNNNTQKKFWMGPMGNWKNLQEAGLDWFMLRWYLSRNLLSDFVIILMITNLIGL